MKRSAGWYSKCSAVLLTVYCFFAENSALWAGPKDDEVKEPVWVLSWAMFIFFLGLTIALMARSANRPNSVLTSADAKQIDDEKRAAKKKKR
ncbi:MAG: hypothetical protein Q4G69_04085 [Planctomycetia bacterium]|nr:hypothetical protein [Planctomycetia bacterium]